MTPEDLATLLDEANHAPWESVRSALEKMDGQPHPRIGWLTAHLTQTKRTYWQLVAAATHTSPPPDDLGLTRLMTWEVGAARHLSPADLMAALSYGDQPWTVEALLRLNARHTVWHAGQIAALARQARLA